MIEHVCRWCGESPVPGASLEATVAAHQPCLTALAVTGYGEPLEALLEGAVPLEVGRRSV